MSKPLNILVAERARDLIADPNKWVQGDAAVTSTGDPIDPWHKDAQRFCVQGALYLAAHELTGDHLASLRLVRSVSIDLLCFGPSEYCPLKDINDGPDGHAAVMELFEAYVGPPAKPWTRAVLSPALRTALLLLALPLVL
jgi:hypothetical protein